jgi:hypothetical protein
MTYRAAFDGLVNYYALAVHVGGLVESGKVIPVVP